MTEQPSAVHNRRNAARCDRCGDEIESVHRHDFKWCSCGALAVDGGLAYTRRLFTPGIPWTELSTGFPEVFNTEDYRKAVQNDGPDD